MFCVTSVSLPEVNAPESGRRAAVFLTIPGRLIQALMERFNADKRIFCFILSTWSGGVGVNLTGADTVVFYELLRLATWRTGTETSPSPTLNRQTRSVPTAPENVLHPPMNKPWWHI